MALDTFLNEQDIHLCVTNVFYTLIDFKVDKQLKYCEGAQICVVFP
jgi:hypothetical protein